MIFLDDLLLLSSSKEELAGITKEVVILLQQLGFLINEEKSTLVPTQKVAYLDFLLDSCSLDDDFSSPGQAGGNSGGLQEDTGPWDGAGHAYGEADREDVSRLTSDTPGPVVLSQLTKGKECCLQSQVHLDQPARQDILWWMVEVPKWNHCGAAFRPSGGVGCIMGPGASMGKVATGGASGLQQRDATTSTSSR